MASTVAIATRRRWPSESSCGARSTHVAHAHRIQGGDDAALDFGALQAHVQRSERDVLAHRRHEQLVIRVLEDQADVSADLPQRPRADRDACDLDFALAQQEAVEAQHQGRLAGAVRAEHGDPLAVRHVQLDAVQRQVAVGVAVADAARVDGAAHAITRSGSSTSAMAATKAASALRKVSGTRWRMRPS